MPETKTSSQLLVAVAWIIVGVPAAWGVYNTALNAKKLFVAPPPAAAPALAPAASK